MVDTLFDGILAPAYIVGHTLTVKPKLNGFELENGEMVFVRNELPDGIDEDSLCLNDKPIYFSSLQGEPYELLSPIEDLERLNNQMVICALGDPKESLWWDILYHTSPKLDPESIFRLQNGLIEPTSEPGPFDMLYLMTDHDIYGLRNNCSGRPSCMQAFTGYGDIPLHRVGYPGEYEVSKLGTRLKVLNMIKGYAENRGFSDAIPKIDGEIRTLGDFVYEHFPGEASRIGLSGRG